MEGETVKRVEIVECRVDGKPVEVQPSGQLGNFKPNMRVEVTSRSKLVTALVVSRNGKGGYVPRRINEGGEVILKAGADIRQFLWPHNMVQLVWTYRDRVKVMSVAVVRHNDIIRVIEEMLIETPIRQEEDGAIIIEGGRAWQDLFRLAQEKGILPAGRIITTYPEMPPAPDHQQRAVVDWYNRTMKGYVTENGRGGNGFGHAVIRHNGREIVVNLVASNFLLGPPLDGLKRGEIVVFKKVVPQTMNFGRNPLLIGMIPGF